MDLDRRENQESFKGIYVNLFISTLNPNPLRSATMIVLENKNIRF